MALETVVFPHDLLNYGYRDLFSLAAGWELDFEEKNLETGSNSLFRNDLQQLQPNSGVGSHFDSIASKEYDTNSSSAGEGFFQACFPTYPAAAAVAPARRKRRRTRSCKNKEEVENQRMTHIAVERNRRKQMNEYLSVLRSLMPPSYIQRGDQASIIGGAINFVKELEQLLQSLEAQKRIKQQSNAGSSTPFADFFTFPQYSTTSTHSNSAANETTAENSSAIANIEVTMVESHANLKVLSRRRPRQLLKMVAQFHDLHLTILHLNITTVDQMVLYSFSAKVEDDCQLTSVDEIATAVHQMLGRIHEEAGLN